LNQNPPLSKDKTRGPQRFSIFLLSLRFGSGKQSRTMDAPAPLEHHAQVEAFSRRHRTGLVTLVFTDIVGSTALKERLGDQAGAGLIEQHHALVRQVLKEFAEAAEISTAGDSFLILFTKPSDAVKFALGFMAKLRTFNQGRAVPLQDRVGIHLGEVVIAEAEGGAKTKDLHGVQVDVCARVMGLAQAGQILLSRTVFDNARQSLKGEEIEGVGALVWLNHGLFGLKGVEAPVEICEVRAAEAGVLSPPTSSEKAQRVAGEAEPVLGWRPALGQLVPNTRWVLEQKLGEGGFGEVWLGRHQTMKERRVFKFCFRADRVRSLKREMTLFRLIKERIGDHPNIVRLLEVYFDHPPYYVEMDYVEGQDLRTWCEKQGGADKVPPEVRLEIVAQVAEALQAAHDAGVIHRDVKPGNTLVSGEWQVTSDEKEAEPREVTSPRSSLVTSHSSLSVKLTDFGIGQVVSEEYLAGMTRAGFTQTMLSSSSSQTGTQLYMAPELLAGKPASTRSDIYSLGVVLYQLLVGDFTRPVTTDWAGDISDPLLREDLRHCFAGKPEDRFAGAGQLAKNLRSLVGRQAELGRQQAALAAAERRAYRRGVVRTAGIAAVIVAVMAALLVFGLQQARRATRQRQRAEAGEGLARQQAYASDMYLAQEALAGGNLGRAQELLTSHQPQAGQTDLRHWEWRYLWQRAQSDALFTLCELPSRAVAVAFSLADGRHLAVRDYHGQVTLWDVATRQKLAVGPSSESWAGRAFAFSPQGQWLASPREHPPGQNTVTVWDSTLTRVVAELPHATAGVLSLAFSPDSKLLASWANDEKVRVWDVEQARLLASVSSSSASGAWKGVVTFSPDGRTLAIGETDGQVRLLDWATGGQRVIPAHSEGVTALAFSFDGKLLASASGYSEHAIKLWESATGKGAGELVGHSGFVFSVAFAPPDGRILASASGDQTLRLWDLATRQELATFRGHQDEVQTVAFSPDGTRLATGCKDGSVCLWDPTRKPKATGAAILPARAHDLAFMEDGHSLVTAGGSVVVWNLATLRPTTNLTALGTNNTSVAFSPTGHLIAVGDDVGSLRVWDWSVGRLVAGFVADTRRFSVRFSAQGRIVISQGSSVKLWETNSWREITPWRAGEKVVRADCSPDGRTAVAGYGDGTVAFWNTVTGRKETTCAGHKEYLTGLAVSPDGQFAATCAEEGPAKLWSLSARREVASMGGPSPHFSVTFSPDGRRVATGNGGDTAIGLWDVDTRREVATLGAQVGLFRVIAFSADGNTLAGIGDGVVHVWRAPSFAEIDATEKAAAPSP
jgi:WD40 repeat protein/class 3 adenylate cyclase